MVKQSPFSIVGSVTAICYRNVFSFFCTALRIMDSKVWKLGVVFALFSFLVRVVFSVSALDLTRPEVFVASNHLTFIAQHLNTNKEQSAFVDKG